MNWDLRLTGVLVLVLNLLCVRVCILVRKINISIGEVGGALTRCSRLLLLLIPLLLIPLQRNRKLTRYLLLVVRWLLASLLLQ